MNSKDKSFFMNLQKKKTHIRNLCILAHVDHGKTTLADALLASNGIISSKMSGKLRYMDSRQDEQERGITMKSSAVSLVHFKNNEEYVINLIDSPGHVDFSTEVSTAVRLCDGAVILIDVCEGICPQTHAVLRQASSQYLKLILILNKVDRLILELKMTPLEAYNHMMNILGQFNALVAEQFTSLVLEKHSNQEHLADEPVEWEEEDESKIYFSPKFNNVFFTSAIDGWGFSLNNFVDLYSTKLGLKRETLKQTLWGDYYLNAKNKMIMKNAQNKGKKPLFVQFVLDSLWQVYEAFYIKRDTVMIEKILNSLNIKMTPRELKYTEAKGPLQTLFGYWLPLGRNLMDVIVDVLPNPSEMTTEKVEYLMCSKLKAFKSLPQDTQRLKQNFLDCDSNESKPVIVFISKMFAADKESICAKKQLTLEEIAQKREQIRLRKLEEASGVVISNTTNTSPNAEKSEENKVEEVEEKAFEFLAFARVFSGTLKKGQTLFVLSPKHNPEDFIGKSITLDSKDEEIRAISKHVKKFTLNEIYLMMGRELELIDEVPCGNIVAIGGLENIVLKSATLSSSVFCPSFSSLHLQTSPIVRVAIEPKNPSKMKELVKGLKLLNQADPCVEIFVQENGEHILCTAGEVHLQRCLDDLVQRFAKIPITTSPPIIPFKETIVQVVKSPESTATGTKEKTKADLSFEDEKKEAAEEESVNQSLKSNFTVGQDGLIEAQSSDKKISLAVRAKPLPTEITRYLEENSHLIRLLNKLNNNRESVERESIKMIQDFKNELSKLFDESNWNNLVDRIISFGPNKTGPNILVNSIDETTNSVWSVLNESSQKRIVSTLREYENGIIFGFNLTTSKGPICEEPMQGVAFFIDKFQVDDQKAQSIPEQQSEEEILERELGQGLEKLSLKENGDDEVNADDLENTSFQKIEKKIKMQTSQTSQCLALMKEACKKAFEVQPQRLMAAMYKCEIMTFNSEALGRLYAVLGKRNAKILEETIKEGTSMFIITAHIPVADSFGMAEEIRKRTSGLATLHIEFSHFEIIEIDPYWEPSTEEELLLYGEKADFENQAKKYMNDVRKRKGLLVREKLVEHSEKQRTLIK